jgi:tRNA threonylcarbamoyl adenosine modification protein YeaZ
MFLILDFTQSFRLALIHNGKLVNKELKIKKNISEILIIEIDKFLKKSHTNIKKIKSIYIITGPGSFTGIRTALTFAKALKLTMNLNVFGLSKFELINFKMGLSKIRKTKCIILHFRNNEFFIQSFKGNKSINSPTLVNFDNEKFRYNSSTIYICNINLLKKSLKNRSFLKIKDNFHLIDYNLKELPEIIDNNMIDKIDPKPLYINNYF